MIEIKSDKYKIKIDPECHCIRLIIINEKLSYLEAYNLSGAINRAIGDLVLEERKLRNKKIKEESNGKS